MRNDLIASKALSEAKSVSKYLRLNTNLSVVDRNKIAENYFKKTLTHKFSKLYRESAEPNIFVTFITIIGDWIVSLFGKMGDLFKMIGGGIQKLGSSLVGSTVKDDPSFLARLGSALNPFNWFKSAPANPPVKSLHSVITNILGMDITLAQAIGIAAILGLCLWGVYKLVKWLWNKFKKAEAYVPMFNKQDNKFLVMLKNTSNLNEGLGDFFKESVNKFAKYCIEKGREVLPKIQEAASKIPNPKLQQFVSEIGPAFSKLIKSPTMKAFKTSASESFETARQNVKKLAPKAKEFLGGTVQGIKQGFAARRG